MEGGREGGKVVSTHLEEYLCWIASCAVVTLCTTVKIIGLIVWPHHELYTCTAIISSPCTDDW